MAAFISTLGLSRPISMPASASAQIFWKSQSRFSRRSQFHAQELLSQQTKKTLSLYLIHMSASSSPQPSSFKSVSELKPKSMKVLIVGSGGREHALAYAVKQSPFTKEVFAAPGNVGMGADGIHLLSNIGAEDVDAIVTYAKTNAVDFVIIGPEAALVKGVVDKLEQEGIPAFGPRASAAILEGSKVFTKDFMMRHNIPTAWYAKFDRKHAEEAKRYVRTKSVPIVIKADGLAAGKGVILAKTFAEADEAIDQILVKNAFGDAGDQVVIEQFLIGEEASFFAILDGETCVPLASAQDHKAAYDGDKGPNTGGMGSYSPAPVVSDRVYHNIMKEVVIPTARGMVKEGRPFRGVLYVGIMCTAEGIKVLEYNVRFGDPECQVLCSRIKSDLLQVLYAAATGDLKKFETLEWHPYKALVVVLASKGYPGDYKKNTLIRNVDAANSLTNVKVFHAGTVPSDKPGEYLSNGGRVLGVTARGDTIASAQKLAYEAIDRIDWPEGFCRRDIGWRAIERETNPSR